MTRIIGLALLALSAANLGGNDGAGRGSEVHADGGHDVAGAMSRVPVVERMDVARGSSQGEGDASLYSLRIHNLASDGIATPEPVATATAVPGVTPIPEPEPTQDAPVFGVGVEQWRGLVASVFPAWAVSTVLRIMDCESEGNPNATGRAGERGLMQISPYWHQAKTDAIFGTGANLYDPYINLTMASVISDEGRDWSAWTCQP